MDMKDEIRKMISSALDKNLYVTAISLAEELITHSLSDEISDLILYAKCHYLNREPKRCLAFLEQQNLLSFKVIKLVCDIMPHNTQEINVNDSIPIKNLETILLAANCLMDLNEFEDCWNLLDPLIYLKSSNGEEYDRIVKSLKSKIFEDLINPIANLYCVAGKCLQHLENRTKALAAFRISISIDPACLEALEEIIDKDYLPSAGKIILFHTLEQSLDTRLWLKNIYEERLLDKNPFSNRLNTSDNVESFEEIVNHSKSATNMIKIAIFSYEKGRFLESYQLSRRAYSMDPFHSRGLVYYIACLVQLKLSDELFYLGHELVHTHPKNAVSWYAVGCYYWSSQRYELAQKNLHKSVKLDKTSAKAWIMLGHVLCCVEESEQAVTAYRSAVRLSPNDPYPLVCIAKELCKTNSLSLSLHVLHNAYELSESKDVQVLNELGIIYSNLGKIDMSFEYFGAAVSLISQLFLDRSGSDGYLKDFSICVEIFSNYATILRKMGQYDAALYWFQQCLSIQPSDPQTLFNIGFIDHICCRFEDAILRYHRTLAIDPNLTFCVEMLNQAMLDSDKHKCILSW